MFRTLSFQIMCDLHLMQIFDNFLSQNHRDPTLSQLHNR